MVGQQLCSIGCHDDQCDVCASGASQCSSGTLNTCVLGQWQPVNDCPNGCDATTGACLACPPGGTFCGDANTLLTCNAAGVWQVTNCADGCNSTYHICNACVPGSMQCGGGNVQTCGSDGIWRTTAVCSAGCINNACAGVCTPGATRCSPDGSAVQTCNSNGQWQSLHCIYGCDPTGPNCNPNPGCGKLPCL
jgi:hypothetical protein